MYRLSSQSAQPKIRVRPFANAAQINTRLVMLLDPGRLIVTKFSVGIVLMNYPHNKINVYFRHNHQETITKCPNNNQFLNNQ